ncbi:MAG: sigma-54-dependent Fis family transcriptional regulator [Planctomycetaceae bacterium]|nr:sigma-54-dependent Fis family transcriptional regulator [Planctomycetaceae bacterium]
MKPIHGGSWLRWSEAFPPGDSVGGPIGLADRILKLATSAEDRKAFLSSVLSEVATEFAAQWSAVRQRTPAWTTIASWGRSPADAVPDAVLSEAQDRDAAGYLPASGAAGVGTLVTPLGEGGAAFLILCGRAVDPTSMPHLLAVGRAIGHGLAILDLRSSQAARTERLKATLDVAGQFARTRETKPLLELIAAEACRLLEADRASIFIWNRDRREVVARPAVGLEDLRFPDNVGVVGDVLRSGQPTRVDDTSHDPRFGKQVDAKTGYRTKNLVAVPLRGGSGEIVGVFEAINKHEGTFGPDDEESLSLLGVQAALAMENAREREDLVRSRDQLAERVTQGVQLIGDSPAMQALRATVQRLAATDLPVLLLGESGTGKEVVAQTLHFQGPRSGKPFIAVNCAAITETLLESELFGHEAGAFTDAREARQGKFELASGGTLFLDEIGDMSGSGQAKLLRVLEQKVVTRVGGSRPIPVDVRIVAATNANLRDLVRQNKFREDLYYRLSVVTQPLPPMRDRPDDIIPLAEHFLKHFSVQARRPGLSLSSEAKRRLQAHAWPGNVRELRNLMERLAFLTPNDRIEPDDLQFTLSPERDDAHEPSFDFGLMDATKEFQRDFITRAVKRVKGNMSDAAKLLGLHRSNLYRKMRQLDMEVEED